MTAHRIISVAISLLFILGLGWSQAEAERAVIQLCGISQGVADTIRIQAADEGDGSGIFASNWEQLIPNLYKLVGPGTVTFNGRDFNQLSQFSGTFFVGNNSDSFGSNPVCVVDFTLRDDPNLPWFEAQAIETCVDGPGAPFRITLPLRMIACQGPAFPGSDARMSSQTNETRIPAGQAPNEWSPK